MTEFPPSLTRHSPPWFVAVGLGVVGDLAGMIATFMPMKVILILALGDVPGFFPSFLVEGGAVFASLVLLLGAGLSGGVAWLAGVVTTRMDYGPVQRAGSTGQLADWNPEIGREAIKVRTFQTSAIVTLPVIAVLVLVSPPYLGFAAVWVGASAVGVLVKVRRSSERAPFFSGVDQFADHLTRWLRTTALVSMVGLAVITLFVAPPVLGSTAILIAAIFGRRLISAVADLVPEVTSILTTQASKRAQSIMGILVTNQPTATTVRWPIEFFASPVGFRRLGKYLEASGFARDDFAVLGAPTGPSLSLLAGVKNTASAGARQMLIRVFGTRHEEAKNRELLRRENSRQSGLFPDLVTRGGVVAGFPAIEVELDSPEVLADLSTEVTRHQAIAFQLEREVASVLAFTGDEVTAPTTLVEAEFRERLERAGRIPGAHASVCVTLIGRIGEAFEHINTVPPTLIPSTPLTLRDFYTSHTSSLCYLGGHSWSVGRMGDRWGRPEMYASLFEAVIKKHELDGTINGDAVLLNAELHALNRALQNFQLGALISAVTAVHSRLDRLKED